VPVLAEVDDTDCCTPVGTTSAFDEFMPCMGATTGATWTLTDPRDNKTYKVKLMEDGHVWMVQDLKFGSCSGIVNWYNDNSAAATTHTPTVASGYVGHCVASSNQTYGYYYSWPAAMNSQYAYYASSYTFCSGTASGIASPAPGYCRGICPEGWHVPTGGSQGELQILSTRAGCSAQSCYFTTTWINPVRTGYTDNAGNIINAGNESYYWSSTSSSSGAYTLSASELKMFFGTKACDNNTGRAVRCVMNY
jgi:uncharacterized protein (TIGR02145 family)